MVNPILRQPVANSYKTGPAHYFLFFSRPHKTTDTMGGFLPYIGGRTRRRKEVSLLVQWHRMLTVEKFDMRFSVFPVHVESAVVSYFRRLRVVVPVK